MSEKINKITEHPALEKLASGRDIFAVNPDAQVGLPCPWDDGPWQELTWEEIKKNILSTENGWEIVVHDTPIFKFHLRGNINLYAKNFEKDRIKGALVLTMLTGEKVEINPRQIVFIIELRLVTFSKEDKLFTLFIAPNDRIVNDCGDKERIDNARHEYAGPYINGREILR